VHLNANSNSKKFCLGIGKGMYIANLPQTKKKYIYKKTSSQGNIQNSKLVAQNSAEFYKKNYKMKTHPQPRHYCPA
jgi:hypothetical protein